MRNTPTLNGDACNSLVVVRMDRNIFTPVREVCVCSVPIFAEFDVTELRVVYIKLYRILPKYRKKKKNLQKTRVKIYFRP
jgi:hypothetical protein